MKSLITVLLVIVSFSAYSQKGDIITYTSLVNCMEPYLYEDGDPEYSYADELSHYRRTKNDFYKAIMAEGFILNKTTAETGNGQEEWGYDLVTKEQALLWLYFETDMKLFRTIYIRHCKEGYEYLESKVKAYCKDLGIAKLEMQDGGYVYANSYLHERTQTIFNLFQTQGSYNLQTRRSITFFAN